MVHSRRGSRGARTGGDRVIEKIHLEHDAQSLGGKATVEIFGGR